VNVLHEHNQRPFGDDIAQELCPGVVEAIAGDERVQVAGDVKAEGEPENLAGAEPVERHFWCVALQQAEVFLQHLAERPIRSPCSIREAAAGATERLGLLIRQLLPELTYESRLPDARIAEDGHKPGRRCSATAR
jgi:hypothetical protein